MSASEASQQANRAEMDPKRLVVVAYLVLGVIVAMFLGQIFDSVLAQLGASNPRVIEGLDFKMGDILTGVGTIGLGFWAWTHPRSHTWSMEVANELMRVTWPSWEETRISTLAVVAASLIAGVLLFFIDSLSYKFMVEWLPFIWGKL